MDKSCSKLLCGQNRTAEQLIIKKALKLQYNKEQEANTNHTFNVNLRNNIHILSTKS
jgi:hypothetical protein